MSLDQRAKWKQGVDRYLAFHPTLKVDELRWSLELVVKILPHMGTVDARFKKFPISSYNVGRYTAHGVLYHALRNRFEALKMVAEKAKEMARSKKAEEDAQRRQDA